MWNVTSDAHMANTHIRLTLSFAWRLYVTRLRQLLALMALPVVALLATTACEALLLQDPPHTTRGVLLVYAISAVRLLAFGMGLGALTWFCAAALIEDTPSLAEALEAGWNAAWRCAFACLPLWALALLYAMLVALACRAALELFHSVGPLMRGLAVALVLACAAPPVILLAAKYTFLIPVVMLSRPRPVHASARAGMLLPWRGVWATVPYVMGAAVFTCVCVLLPSVSYVSSVWLLLGEAHVTLPAVCARHCAAACVFWLGAPLAACTNTLLYCAFYAPWRGPAGEEAAAAPQPSSPI